MKRLSGAWSTGIKAKVGTYRTVPIYIDITWGIQFTVLTAIIMNAATIPLWAGLITAIISEMCILMHELAHVRAARVRNMPVSRVIMMLVGVNAEMPPCDDPKRSIAIAAAGPLMSLSLMGLFLTLTVLRVLLADMPHISDSQWTHDTLMRILGSITIVNGLMTAINLLPAVPLDGGVIIQNLAILLFKNRLTAAWIGATPTIVVALGALNYFMHCFVRRTPFNPLSVILCFLLGGNAIGTILRETRRAKGLYPTPTSTASPE